MKNFASFFLVILTLCSPCSFSGVRYVVDAGLSKRRSFTAATGMDTLRAESCSRSEAKQRAGRAGREAPGKCWRLYTELAFEERALAAEPEIRRVDLAEVVLQLLVKRALARFFAIVRVSAYECFKAFTPCNCYALPSFRVFVHACASLRASAP